MAELKYLVRIAKADLDGKKNLGYGLRKIKGVGLAFANAVCHLTGISKSKKVGALSDDEVKKLDLLITDPEGIPSWLYNRRRDYDSNSDKHLISGNLIFNKENDIKRMRRIRSYKGVRHGFGLPVRGQKTKSNFRKNKGKVTLGVKRKKGGK